MRRELLDLAQLPEEPLVDGRRSFLDRLTAEELIGRDAERVGDRSEQMGRRVIGLRLVIRDDAIGNAVPG